MSEIISNNEWLDNDKSKIEQKDKADADLALNKAPKKLAEELWTNYTLDCWVEEDKCRAVWVDWVVEEWSKLGVDISSMKTLLWEIHKNKDITLNDNQIELAKQVIIATWKELTINKPTITEATRVTNNETLLNEFTVAINILNDNAKGNI